MERWGGAGAKQGGESGEILRKNRAGEGGLEERSRRPVETRARRAAAAAAARQRPGGKEGAAGVGGREKLGHIHGDQQESRARLWVRQA